MKLTVDQAQDILDKATPDRKLPYIFELKKQKACTRPIMVITRKDEERNKYKYI